MRHEFTVVSADGRKLNGVFRCKLIQLSDDAEDFALWQPALPAETGFVAPPEAAKEIDFSRHATANDIGLAAFLHGIIDTQTVCELVEFHTARGSGTP